MSCRFIGYPEPKQKRGSEQAEFRGDRELLKLLLLLFLLQLLGNSSLGSFRSSGFLLWLFSSAFAISFVCANGSRFYSVLRLLSIGLLCWYSTVSAFPKEEFSLRLLRDARQNNRTKRLELRDTFSFVVTSRVEHLSSSSMRFRARLKKQGEEFGEVFVDAPDVPWSELSEAVKGASGEASFTLTPLVDGAGKLPLPFSYDAYLYRRGMVASAKLLELTRVETLGEPGVWDRFVRALVESFPRTSEFAVVLAATVAEDNLLDARTKSVFQNTGLTHVLVVSGYQVGLIFVLSFSALRFLFSRSERLPLRFSLNTLATCGAVCVAEIYAEITGSPITAERAVWALAIMAFGKILGRKVHLFRSFGVLLIVSMLLWPGSIFEPGFQLMFLALLGLMAVGAVASDLERRTNWNEKLLTFISLAFIPTCFTTPVVIIWFEIWVPAAGVFNLVFAFLMSIVCTSFSGIALLGVYLSVPGSAFFFRVGLWLTSLLLDALSFLAELAEDLHMDPVVLEGEPKGIAVLLSTLIVCGLSYYAFFDIPRRKRQELAGDGQLWQNRSELENERVLDF